MKALLLAATLLAPVSAFAVIDPTPGPKDKDSLIRSLPYDPQQAVRLTATGETPLTLILEPGEHGVTFAGEKTFKDPKQAAEASGWLVKDSGDVIVIQALAPQQTDSSLFVHTKSADGVDRYYPLVLRTRKGSITDDEAYMTVQFRYKHVPTPEEIAAARARREAWQQAADERAAKARLASAEAETPRNYRYAKRDPNGCPLLAPVYVFDDGHRTTLVFAPHAVLPEVYTINQDGKEAIATTINDSTATGLQVVLPTVQREMRLRRGGKVCALRNDAFDPVGTQPGGGSGTVSPDVVRQLRAGR